MSKFCIFEERPTPRSEEREPARFRSRENAEEVKPENVGVNIVYDWKIRVLLRNGNVIDKFSPNFF